MKHRHLRVLLRGAILPPIENRHVVSSTQRQPQLYPPTLEAALYNQRPQPALFAEVEALERKSVSTAEIRLLLLNELAHLRRFIRRCQYAGTGHRRRQGHLVQRIRLFLDRLPSPRHVPAARFKERIGSDNYPDCWENYVDERRLIRARDKRQQRLPPLARAAELILPDERRMHTTRPPWRQAA